jgi:hypothetical protein
MKRPIRVAAMSLALVLMSSDASALSVRKFDNATREQQTEILVQAVHKIVADVSPVNPKLADGIRDYFEVTPSGKSGPPGMIAFVGELGAVENLAEKGKMDLDKVQIEGILLDIVKTDVMPKFAPPDKKK